MPESTNQYHQSAAHFFSGFVAGVLASIVTQPADVIKTNMQLDKQNPGISYTMRKIYNYQGVGGFTTGLAPRMLRRTLMAAFAWTIYEKMIKSIGLK